jgi:uncharacterized membrane protein
VSRLPALILFPLLLAPLMLCTLGATARATLNVCNKTAHAASVAVGFFNGKAWSSVGWWTVAAGGCESLIKEPLNARYYYLYAAQQDVGGAWAAIVPSASRADASKSRVAVIASIKVTR